MQAFVQTLLLIATGAAATAALAWRQPVQRDGPIAIVTPARTAPDPPPATPPPPIPPELAEFAPATLVFETSSGAHARPSVQTVTRSRDRVRLVPESGAHEWLFVQNAIYPNRAIGYLTNHSAREIRVFEESALRDALGIRGWLDVVTLRFVTSGTTAKIRRHTYHVDRALLADPIDRFPSYAHTDPADAHDH